MSRLLPAVFLLIGSVCAAHATESCALQQDASIDMGLDEVQRIEVPMTIGRKTLAMLVDTGGLFSSLKDETVDALKLKRLAVPPRYRITMFGGDRIRSFVFADTIALGNLRIPQLGFLVMPSGHTPPSLSGSIAPDLLRNYDVEFDLAGGKLNLFSPEHCPGKVVYWTHNPYAKLPMTLNADGQIEFTGSLDGKTVRAGLDTGSSHSVLTIESARSMFGWGNKMPTLTPVSERSGEPFFYRYPFSTLTFDGITITHPDILLISEAHRGLGSSAPDMIVGMSILRQLRTYIAYHEHAVYFTAAEAH